MGHKHRIWAEGFRLLGMNCQTAAQLISRRLDEPLAWHERCALRLHLALCVACRRFTRQVVFLRTLSSRLNWSSVARQTIRPEAYDRISRAVQSALRN